MKTINKLFLTLGVAGLCMGATSCVDDLDKSPVNPSEITNVSGDINRVFADIYLNFSTYGPNGQNILDPYDAGMGSFQRAMFTAECLPTDEACWLWDPQTYGTMNYGYVNPSTASIYGFYSRLIINITLCNQFINSAQNGVFEGVPQETIDEYIRQARILRGGCYYYMLSFYDKVPYADENTLVGQLPQQLPRAEVYNLVTADLEKVVAEYAPNQVPHYGFVGLDVAEAILAKIYLNGEVFAGRADYDKCYSHCKNIIARLGKGGFNNTGLAQSYKTLFGANNKKYVLGNAGSDVNEIIWTLAQNDPNLLSYSGATFMCVAWLGDNGVKTTAKAPKREDYATAEEFNKAREDYAKLEDWEKTVSNTVNGVDYSYDPNAKGHVTPFWYNTNKGWKGMVGRKSFIRKFEWNDSEMSESDDTRTEFFLTSKYGFSPENTELVGDNWGNNGYITPKFTNWNFKDDGSLEDVQPEPKEQIGGDYGMIRLAEIYLTAAEAILQGGGGTQAEALQYVNNVRARAYGDQNHNFAVLNMQTLQDERCRELYSEAVRRSDLIRWNLWCTGYNWEWKGGNPTGTNLQEYTKLYPIPESVMISSNFEQTTGY